MPQLISVRFCAVSLSVFACVHLRVQRHLQSYGSHNSVRTLFYILYALLTNELLLLTFYLQTAPLHFLLVSLFQKNIISIFILRCNKL